MLEEVIPSGAALDKLVEVVIAQGDDPAVINDPDRLPAARHETVVIADRDGVITRCDALDLGVAAMRLGAGRATKEDVIDQSAGITVEAKVGDAVERGDALARLHWNDESRLAEATELANGAFQIGEGPAIPPSLVLGEVR